MIDKSPAMENFRKNVLQQVEDGVSISHIAESADVSRPHLSRILHGYAVCSLPVAERIAFALGISLDLLILPARKKISQRT